MSKAVSWIPRSTLAITFAGFSLIVLLGLVDLATGSELSFSIFYLLPISLLTWFTNRRIGIISAFVSTVVWLLADLTTHSGYANPLIPFWNAFVRFSVFLAIVLLESALKKLNQGLEEKVKDRTASLRAEVAEREKVEERLQQYTRWLEILHDNDQAILAAASPRAAALTTILHVERLPSCDRANLVLFDYETQQAVVFDASGRAQDNGVKETYIPLARLVDFIAMVEALQGQLGHLETDLQGSQIIPAIAAILPSRKIRSLMVLPIYVLDELVGSLNLMAIAPNAFSSDHLGIGRELTNQLGIAFQQAEMIDQLQTNQDNLQALSKRLLGVQEAERRHIARELHDEVGQALTGIGLTLEMAAHLQTSPAAEKINQARVLVVELMDKVSSLSLELRPSLLDDLGILPTLLWYTDRYASQTGIKVDLRHSGLENRRFRPEIETAAYRIAQEGLTNVARHARVREVRLAMWYDQNCLGIQIQDKGVGFEPQITPTSPYAGGLLGMQERAWLLNGTCAIESASGKGTRITAEIPVDVPVGAEGE